MFFFGVILQLTAIFVMKYTDGRNIGLITIIPTLKISRISCKVLDEIGIYNCYRTFEADIFQDLYVLVIPSTIIISLFTLIGATIGVTVNTLKRT